MPYHSYITNNSNSTSNTYTYSTNTIVDIVGNWLILSREPSFNLLILKLPLADKL